MWTPKIKKMMSGQDFWYGLRLWNKDKSSELALISFGGVRRWYAGSHQVIAISYRQRLPGPDARKTEIDQVTRKWSLLGGVWHEKAEWSSPQIKKISWQANESQHSPNPELLAWCHSLLWSIRPTETDIRNELSEQGVTLVKRVRRKEQGQEKDTNTLFSTFCNVSLPKDICTGY